MSRLRGACVLGLLASSVASFVVFPDAALAADAVTLRAPTSPVSYGGRAVLSGSIAPAAAGESVGIYAQTDETWTLVGTATTDSAGMFSLVLTADAPGTFLARGADSAGGPVDSAPVSVVVRPRVVASLRGSRQVGGRLYLVGSMLPRTAGVLTVSEGPLVGRVRVRRNGRFRAALTTTRLFRYRARVRLRPAPGYVGWQRAYSVRVGLPPLAIGSRGRAVAWLEQRLHRVDGYALPGVDGAYDAATADAVLAFQDVNGLPRTGSVDSRMWQALRTSGPPVARVRSGSHIEVDKTRQVLFEVRAGKVVSVAHVSTGATGNTPPGLWHVYAKSPGFNAKGMYDSLFFLRGFAIHGYYSVPSYPASHGCVRTPIWFASGLFARWGVGTSVYVFP